MKVLNHVGPWKKKIKCKTKGCEAELEIGGDDLFYREFGATFCENGTMAFAVECANCGTHLQVEDIPSFIKTKAIDRKQPPVRVIDPQKVQCSKCKSPDCEFDDVILHWKCEVKSPEDRDHLVELMTGNPIPILKRTLQPRPPKYYGSPVTPAVSLVSERYVDWLEHLLQCVQAHASNEGAVRALVTMGLEA